MDKTLISIVGPTAVGKTDTAIALAQYFNTEIISSDSRQVYQEMKIGTAPPSPEQLSLVKHHLIAHKSIHEYYSANIFEQEALSKISDIFQHNNVAIMVGGSGMYIDAVLKGMDELPTTTPELRQQIISQYNTEGIESLRMQLKRLDPTYYDIVDLKNPNRLMKAIEVSLMTGKPYSSFLNKSQKQRDFRIVKIGLNIDRTDLYQRINLRVDLMKEAGLIEEARELYPFREVTALKTVGYRELFDYFEEKTSLDEALEKIKINTRRYAKRQLTWFTRDKDIKWFTPFETKAIISSI